MEIKRTTEIKLSGGIRIFERGPFVVIEQSKNYSHTGLANATVSVGKKELILALKELEKE